MATKINYIPANRRVAVPPMAAPEETGQRASAAGVDAMEAEPLGTPGCNCAHCECKPCDGHCVEFCETITLHELFDADRLDCAGASIAYDTSYLGYTTEELITDAELPFGGTCKVRVLRITLNGAIPYIMSAGPVRAQCGSCVPISVSGSTMVDEVIGYICCGDTEPELEELSCNDVTPCVRVETSPCGCSGKTNVTFHGKFVFSGLPTTISGCGCT